MTAGVTLGGVVAVGSLAYAVGAEPGWTPSGTRGTVELTDDSAPAGPSDHVPDTSSARQVGATQ